MARARSKWLKKAALDFPLRLSALAPDLLFHHGIPGARVLEPGLMVIGIDFRNAPEALRERFWISPTRRRHSLRFLTGAEGIEEALVFSTSERTEFLIWASDPALAANSVLRLLSSEYSLQLCQWEHFYRLLDEEAVVHVFRLVAGLEAIVPGDPQIASDLKQAWEEARQTGSCGECLDAVVQNALLTSEQVRKLRGGGSQSTSSVEDLVTTAAKELHHKLAREHPIPPMRGMRERLDQICRQELQQLRLDRGPFPKEQDQVLATFASSIAQRLATSLVHELKEDPELCLASANGSQAAERMKKN